MLFKIFIVLFTIITTIIGILKIGIELLFRFIANLISNYKVIKKKL